MRAAARTIWVVVLLLLVPFAAGNWDGMQDSMQLRTREMEAFRYLQESAHLEAPLIGFSMEYSGGLIAMRILHRSPMADAAFKELLRSGTTSGQLYGLIGVRRTDPLFFEEVSHRYASSTGVVGHFSGCIIDGESIATLVRKKGALQLAHNESLRQWAEKRSKGEQWPPIDIAGGGYSSVYFDRGAIDDKQLAIAIRSYDFSR